MSIIHHLLHHYTGKTSALWVCVSLCLAYRHQFGTPTHTHTGLLLWLMMMMMPIMTIIT